MYLSEEVQNKWAPILEHPDLPKISDPYRRAVTAMILENQERAFMEENRQLNEVNTVGNFFGGQTGFSGAANAGGPVAGFDPILISLVRRSLPNLIAYDICGVQPMTGPTGLIFAMRSTYGTDANIAGGAVEAFFNEPNTGFGGIRGSQLTLQTGGVGAANTFSGNAAPNLGLTTANAEVLTAFGEMGFSIEKVTVSAKTRALKSEYTMELAQDLKSVHGLDAETELSNILASEILAEINREIVRTVYQVARIGCQTGTTNAGTFDLDVDSNGRWMVEKVKGLAFQFEREANLIARTTRRGKGNIMITSSDVASALAMAGILDYQSALKDAVNLQVDDTGNTFAGTLFGRIKVYIDPYAPNAATREFAVLGYKGTNAYDAGIFYCPYVPLQMVRAVDTSTFQPKIAFKTRYGIVANPFAGGDTVRDLGVISAQSNNYYRGFQIANLM